MTTSDLLPEILKLSADEQRIIADTLWRSLREKDPVDEAEFKRELDRRASDADQHPETMVPWDEAIRQLRAKR